jgi:hypothetical protein
MAKVFLAAFDNVDYGGYGRGGQIFDGYSQAQDRVEIASAPASFPGAAQMTVQNGSNYLTVTSTGWNLVYAGPASGFDKETRGVVCPPGVFAMAVAAGHVVFVRALEV